MGLPFFDAPLLLHMQIAYAVAVEYKIAISLSMGIL
jgi:hypothetical protein